MSLARDRRLTPYYDRQSCSFRLSPTASLLAICNRVANNSGPLLDPSRHGVAAGRVGAHADGPR